MAEAISQHKSIAMGKQPSGSGGKPSTPKTYGKGGKVTKGSRKGC
jgi:hypothetical protein